MKKSSFKFESISVIIIGISIILTFAVLLVALNNKNNMLINLHNKIATKAELQKIGDNLYKDVAFLSTRIASQNQTIKDLKNDVKYFASITAEKPTETIVIHSDSIQSTSTGKIYPLKYDGQGFHLEGNFSLPEKVYVLNASFDPINFKIYAYEDDEGLWNTLVETSNPYYTIGSIDSKISPFKHAKLQPKNWWVYTGVYTGKSVFGGSVGIGYMTYQIGLNYDYRGGAVAFHKLWRF